MLALRCAWLNATNLSRRRRRMMVLYAEHVLIVCMKYSIAIGRARAKVAQTEGSIQILFGYPGEKTPALC